MVRSRSVCKMCNNINEIKIWLKTMKERKISNILGSVKNYCLCLDDRDQQNSTSNCLW